MITLPIKKQWFDMIAAGEKKEEYREIKPYYTVRIANEVGESPKDIYELIAEEGEAVVPETIVHFTNGYGNKCPSFYAECSVVIGTGREEWGAVPGTEYYIFKINRVYK